MMSPVCLVPAAARKEFWDSKDPSDWSNDEKQVLLFQSPWARGGVARMEVEKNRRTTPGYGMNGRPGADMPDLRPGSGPGGAPSIPFGEKPPPVPNPDKGRPVEFQVLARWESAKPVRLASGPETLEMPPQSYVIRLRGLPLMPPPKPKRGEVPPNPNEAMLQAIKQGSSLERKDKPGIQCAHLFTGTGHTANEVLLFFPQGSDSITIADKLVTLESRFAPFHLSVKFPLKEMIYKGDLAL